MHPRGLSNEQLLWRLRDSGIRVSASEILSTLTTLAERGEIVRMPDQRWRRKPSTLQTVNRSAGEPGKTDPSDQTAVSKSLFAVNAISRPINQDEAELGATPTENQQSELPEPELLLRYYAATQRKDPRGRITTFPDLHAESWQLMRMSGTWWADNLQLEVFATDLPDTFREALSRRNVDSAALGYPLLLSETKEGQTIYPAFLFPVEWRVQDDRLIMNVQPGEPSINPDWLSQVIRQTQWTEHDLLERLWMLGEAQDLGSLSDRLRHTLATLGAERIRVADLENQLPLQRQGLHNCAALILPDDSSFTVGAAKNLEKLASWDRDTLLSTSLGGLFSSANDAVGKDNDHPILSPVLLSETQREAVKSGLTNPLTVIQGPPGTGKSQVIIATIVSALLQGKSVLFASKNHQALDEVETRLKELTNDSPLVTRGRDATGEIDTGFLDAFREIVAGEYRTEADDAAYQKLEALKSDALRLDDHQQLQTDLRSKHVMLCDVADKLERLQQAGEGDPETSDPAPTRSQSWIIKCLTWTGRMLFRKRDRSGDIPAQDYDIGHLLEVQANLLRTIAGLQKSVASMPTEEFQRLEKTVMGGIEPLLNRLVCELTQPTGDQRRALSEKQRELEFNGLRLADALPLDVAEQIVGLRPVWAISTLSVPKRVPLVPNLFDYVIFDETSQCDIASALPLMARAKQAVIVGDPQQLNFIPALGRQTEHALMDSLELPKTGRATYAQSINSLFDFASHKPAAVNHFLKDQFRSAPHIVDYISEDFYRGRMVSQRSEDEFKAPTGYKPGLAWDDVQGFVRREESGCTNNDEAERVAELVQQFASDPNFSGTVGVVSPFNAQVAKISGKIAQCVPQKDRDALKLRVSTVDKFQGGEADVILFSLVLASGIDAGALTFLRRERRRLNVAISRARALCVVVGDLTTAQHSNIAHIRYLARRSSNRTLTPRAPFDSLWERRMSAALKKAGFEPIPQYPVGSRYLDFALEPETLKIDIEVDGQRWHTDADGNRKIGDRLRDRELTARGWTVLRFWVHELQRDMPGCIEKIKQTHDALREAQS